MDNKKTENWIAAIGGLAFGVVTACWVLLPGLS